MEALTGTMSNHLKHIHKSINVDVASSQPKMAQSRITDFKKTPVLNMPKPKWQKITETLARMCTRDHRPLSIVEGSGFKAFCYELNPSYDVPCKTTVGKYLTLSYDQMKSDLIQSISCQPGVSLTTDHWTSLATEGYITVTSHYIDEEWNFNNYVLATRKTTERHTGENIFADIKSICREFQCLHKPPKTGSHMTSSVHHLEVMLIHKLGFFKNSDLNIVFLFNDM